MSADSQSRMHRDPIFSHAGDPRVAASIVLVGIVAALIGGVFMAIGPQLKDKPVRTVGAHGDAVCENQTWPSIEQRCLVRAKTESAAKTSPAKTEDDAKLSPLTATGALVKVQAAPLEPVVVTPDNSTALAPDTTATLANEDPQEVQREPRQRPRRPPGFPFPFGFRF